MPDQIAVAVIHGIGSQGDTRPSQRARRTFSKGLFLKLKDEMGSNAFRRSVVWREIFWADILQRRQQAYLDETFQNRIRWPKSRGFVMKSLADAACYRQIPDSAADVYPAIHARVAETVADLESETGGQAPLVILAHSLGGHIISNYVYDLQKAVARIQPEAAGLSPFQRLDTMAGLITFGCNIPVFLFTMPPEAVRPIARPGAAIPEGKRLTPWWLNINDRDDVLGMPLAQPGTGYADLRDRGELREDWIEIGNIFTRWNPASHNGYWTDDDFVRPVARFLRAALAIGPVAAGTDAERAGEGVPPTG